MVRGLSRALGQQGVEVTLLTTNSNGDVGQPPLDVPLHQPVLEDGYRVYYFACSPFRRYKFSLGLLQWLARHHSQYDLAHIHALFSPVTTAAATVARWQGLPYILRPLGTLDPADLRKKQALKRLYGYALEAPNLRQAAAVHFTSPLEAQVSERFGATTRDVVVPLGVSWPPLWDGVDAGNDRPDDRPTAKTLARLQVRSRWSLPESGPEAPPLVLFMSRIDPKKGLDLLLPSLEALQRSGTPFHFVLAGSNPQDPAYETQIQQRIAQSPLRHCTTITGFVGGADKWALLQAANLFVLPSYYENFGIAVAEAMAAGVPVVVSDQVYIWPDIEAAGAGWVVPCEVAALTGALHTALAPGSPLAQRGIQGRTYARSHYHWEAIAQQMVTVYQQCLR